MWTAGGRLERKRKAVEEIERVFAQLAESIKTHTCNQKYRLTFLKSWHQLKYDIFQHLV